MIHTIVVRTTHRTDDIQLVAFFLISLFLFFGFLYSSFILISKVYKITLLVGTTEKTAISMFGWIYIYFRLKAYTHKNWVVFFCHCVNAMGENRVFFPLDNEFFFSLLSTIGAHEKPQKLTKQNSRKESLMAITCNYSKVLLPRIKWMRFLVGSGWCRAISKKVARNILITVFKTETRHISHLAVWLLFNLYLD